MLLRCLLRFHFYKLTATMLSRNNQPLNQF
jgi:hypothetical protein